MLLCWASWRQFYIEQETEPGIIVSAHVDEPHQELEKFLLEDVGDELLVLAERRQETENENLRRILSNF